MGFLNSGGTGAASFIEGFRNARQDQLKQQELDQMNTYRNAMLKIQQDEEARRAGESGEKVAQGARERMSQQQTPVYPENSMGLSGEIDPLPQAPLSLQERARRFSEVNPAGLKDEITLAGQESKQNPLVAKLIEAAQNGTISEQGKAVLKMAGYDFFTAKQPEQKFITGIGPDGKPTRVVDAPGVTPYEKPATPNLSNSNEDKYDKTTGITFRRSFNYDPANGTRSGHSDWAPIKQEKQPVDPITKIDYEAAKTLIRTLPKLKEDATVAAQSVKTMQDMIGLVEAGSAGAIGRLKGVLAPYAEALGYNSKSLSDAQTYQLLAKTISGSMRMAIVGPGQVSNYETQLLQSISGGGTTATAASKALLQHYADQARAKVDAYNRDRDQLAEVSPQGGKMFPQLIIPAGAAPGNPGGRPPLDSFKR